MWALWALGNAIPFALVSQLSQYWKLPGTQLLRWRCLFPALAALPFVLFIPAPTDPIFYVATAISCVLIPLHDGRILDIAAKHGGVVMLRLRSLMLPLVFIFWLVIDPAYIGRLIQSGWVGAGIIASIALSTLFLFRLKRCTISAAAMKEILPVIVMSAVFDITNKVAMTHAVFPQNSIYYIFLVSGLPLIAMLGYSAFKGQSTQGFVAEMASIAGKGASLGVLWVLMMVAKNIAMILSPNPAYVTAVTLTAPFWASAVMRLRGEKEEADWLSGTALVLCIIALALLSGFMPKQ